MVERGLFLKIFGRSGYLFSDESWMFYPELKSSDKMNNYLWYTQIIFFNKFYPTSERLGDK